MWQQLNFMRVFPSYVFNAYEFRLSWNASTAQRSLTLASDRGVIEQENGVGCLRSDNVGEHRRSAVMLPLMRVESGLRDYSQSVELFWHWNQFSIVAYLPLDVEHGQYAGGRYPQGLECEEAALSNSPQFQSTRHHSRHGHEKSQWKASELATENGRRITDRLTGQSRRPNPNTASGSRTVGLIPVPSGVRNRDGLKFSGSV